MIFRLELFVHEVRLARLIQGRNLLLENGCIHLIGFWDAVGDALEEIARALHPRRGTQLGTIVKEHHVTHESARMPAGICVVADVSEALWCQALATHLEKRRLHSRGYP